MSENNIGGKVVILLNLPDGGIYRDTDLPTDPEHKKGEAEIIFDIIEKGIEGTDWSFFSVTTHSSMSSFILKYGG